MASPSVHLFLTSHFLNIYMKIPRNVTRVVWIVASIIAVLGMIAFTLLPVIYYR